MLFTSVIIFCFKTSAQEGVNIILRVDYELQKKVLHNEPVIFAVSLTNKSAQSDNLWNISADRRLKKIDDLVKEGKMKQEDADKEKQEIEKNKRITASITIGSAASPWTAILKWEVKNQQTNKAIVLPVKLMPNPQAESSALLDAAHSASAYFGIAPEDMAALPAGTYSVSVMINNAVDKVILEVQRETVSATAMREALLLKYGQFYWYAGDSKKTMQYAETILKKNPSSVDGLSLKGDAQVMEGSYLQALESFNEAKKQYYKQNGSSAEPPEYLLTMIGMVKEKLGDVKN